NRNDNIIIPDTVVALAITMSISTVAIAINVLAAIKFCSTIDKCLFYSSLGFLYINAPTIAFVSYGDRFAFSLIAYRYHKFIALFQRLDFFIDVMKFVS